MKQKLRLDPEAKRELRDAIAYYAERSKPAARMLRDRIRDTSRRIADRPLSFPALVQPALDPPVRRALVPDFPFAIVFLVLDDAIQILAIAHTRRRPGYWLERVRSE